MFTAIFSPWQSFSTGFGKLHFWLTPLEAATIAWWSQSVAHGARGQTWQARGNFAWWRAWWWARCTPGQRFPWTAPVSGTEPFVSLLSTGWIQILPDVAGVHTRTLSAATGWSERFLHQKAAMWLLDSRARCQQMKSCLTTALGPGAFLLRFAGRISGFGRARLKFAGAAFRRRFKAKLANKKPLVDKRALQVNNWLSSLNP